MVSIKSVLFVPPVKYIKSIIFVVLEFLTCPNSASFRGCLAQRIPRVRLKEPRGRRPLIISDLIKDGVSRRGATPLRGLTSIVSPS